MRSHAAYYFTQGIRLAQIGPSDELNLVDQGRGHGIHRLAPFDPGKRDPFSLIPLSREAQWRASSFDGFAEGILLARIGKGPTT